MIVSIIALLLNISPANAVIGGSRVSPDEEIAKSTVLLYGVNADKSGYNCTGTILNSQYILTAAHCVTTAKQLFIIFTTSAESGERYAELFRQGTHVRAAIAINHNIDYPNTDLGQSYPHNDVATVRFKGGLPSGYKPVSILNPAVAAQYLQANKTVVIAGFGKRGAEDTASSGVLYKSAMPFQKSVGNDSYIGADQNIACSGDSGGPAFVVVNGRYYQWGIASRSNCQSFSIYTPLKSNFFGRMETP